MRIVTLSFYLEVVSSLFPANVRDRLFEQDGKPRKERTLGEALAGDQKNQTNEAHHLAAHPAKLRLKNFLHDGPEMATGDGKGVLQTKPIADLVSHNLNCILIANPTPFMLTCCRVLSLSFIVSTLYRFVRRYCWLYSLEL